MKLAIVTDSTCDLSQEELQELGVRRVPLYVHFQGNIHRDWIDISPTEIIKGVSEGAELPTTSQPSPQDFEDAFKEAVEAGAEAILCITISATLSGTYQSANVASESVDVPVTIFDSRGASLGAGEMVRTASTMHAKGASQEEIVTALEHIRDSNFVLFTVAGLEYLQKGGRIGRASALVGSLLNIKPILTIGEEGQITPLGRARGNKRALREMIAQIKSYRAAHEGDIVMNFLHIQDPPAAARLRQTVEEAGIDFQGGQAYEIGAVIASHVGPGTYGVYIHTVPG